MSGESSVGRTLLNRSTTPSHSWVSMVTSTFGYCSLNCSMAHSRMESGVWLPLSQTRRVPSVSEGGASKAELPSSLSAAPSSSPPPQAAITSVAARPNATSFLIFMVLPLSLPGPAARPAGSARNEGLVDDEAWCPWPQDLGSPRSGGRRCSRDAQLPIEDEHRGPQEDVVVPERAEPDVDVVADRRHGPALDDAERR